MSLMTYRRDIDGLRAIAVIAVVLYHANIQLFRGGYVGVDVFFVISGYLITGILLRDIRAGSFSIAHFYERRIRRIFPALFAVFAASTAAAYLTLFPGELRTFGQSLTSAVLFVSNVFFLNQDNYFAAPSETTPLLHTWSLAVEEQFYIFFPLILVLIARYLRGAYAACIVVLALASLALSAYMVRTWMPGAFYLAIPRAWELLLGAMLALGMFNRLGRSRPVREVLGLAGLAAIGAAILLFNKTTPFPGFAALLPCVGAALILHSGRMSDTVTHRLLSLKPAVFIGLVSYSLYLWHNPVLAYYKIAFAHDPSRPEKIAVLLACFAFAVVSWKFIEQPFRNPKFLTRKQLFTISAVMMAIFSAIGLTFALSNGLQSRYPAEVQRLAAYANYDSSQDSRDGICFLSSSYDDLALFNRATCLPHNPSRPNWLLMGDSHAAHLFSGLSAVYPEVNLQQATSSGCKPILGANGPHRCAALRDDMLKSFIPTGQTDTVLLSARWSAEDLPGVLETVKYLRQYVKHVYVFGPIVEYKFNLPRALALAEMRHDPAIIARNRRTETAAIDAAFADAVPASGATYISTYRTLCPADAPLDAACTTTSASGVPVQFDYGHLTRTGSVWLAEKWRPLLAPALQAKEPPAQ